MRDHFEDDTSHLSRTELSQEIKIWITSLVTYTLADRYFRRARKNAAINASI